MNLRDCVTRLFSAVLPAPMLIQYENIHVGSDRSWPRGGSVNIVHYPNTLIIQGAVSISGRPTTDLNLCLDREGVNDFLPAGHFPIPPVFRMNGADS